MAAANYDELLHSAGSVVSDWSSMDPLYKWDTHFPGRLSRLSVTPEFSGGGAIAGSGTGSASGTPQRRHKRGRNRNTSRFKTQPITFDEIKEVDEEPRSAEEVKEGLKNQFAAFSRSMDGLVPGYPVLPSCLRTQCVTGYQEESAACRQAGADRGAGADVTTPTASTSAGTSPYASLPASSGHTQPAASNGCVASTSDVDVTTQKAREEAAVFAAVGLNPTLANVQDVSRARRMKRRARKSIEEEPELEKIAAANSQSAG